MYLRQKYASNYIQRRLTLSQREVQMLRWNERREKAEENNCKTREVCILFDCLVEIHRCSQISLDIFLILATLLALVATVVERIRWGNEFGGVASGILLALLALFGFGLLLGRLTVHDLLLLAHWLPAGVLPEVLLGGLLSVVIVIVVVEKRAPTAEQRADDQESADDDDDDVHGRAFAPQVQAGEERDADFTAFDRAQLTPAIQSVGCGLNDRS